MNFKKILTMTFVALMVTLFNSAAFAQTQTFYVNNLTGNDANSGTTIGQEKATVNSAMIAAPSGSIISVAATGVNYIEASPTVRGTYTFAVTGGSGTPIFANALNVGVYGYVGTITSITVSPNSTVTTLAVTGVKNGDVIYIDGTGDGNYDKKYFTVSAVDNTAKTFVINNTAGGVVAAGNVAARGDVTFSGTFQFNGGLSLNVGTLTNGNNVTVQAMVLRTELGSISSGALVYSGAVNLFYECRYTGGGVTVTTGLEWPTANTASNLTTFSTVSTLTLKFGAVESLNGVISTNGPVNLNSMQFNIIGDNAHTFRANVTGTGPMYFTQAAGGAALIGVGAPTLPNIVSDNSANTPTLTINNTIATVGSLTANNASSIAANMAGNTGNILLNGSGGIVTTGNAGPTTSGTVTAAASSTGNITLNNSAGAAYTTGTITQSGTGTITFGGNVTAINVGTTGSSTNVVLNTVIPAFNNTAPAVSGKAVIAFTNVPVIIWGSVTNSASFSGSSNLAGNSSNALILFASAANNVTIKNTLTNSVSGSYAFTGGGTGTGNGLITFANTTGNLTFADVTNSASLSEPNGGGNAYIMATAGGTGTVTFGTMLNNSTYAGANIDLSLMTGNISGTAITESGSVKGGNILLGTAVTVALSGDISSSRGVTGSNIVIGTGAAVNGAFSGHNINNSGASNITINSFSGTGQVNLGTYGISSTGSGTISFPNAGAGSGVPAVSFAFTAFTVNKGTVDFGNGAGGINITGAVSMTAGTINFSGVAAKIVTMTNSTIAIGGVGTKPTFGGNSVNLSFAQPIPNVWQTVTLGTLDNTFPGYISVDNFAALPAPYVFFKSVAGTDQTKPGLLYILNAAAASANGLKFDTGNPSVVNTVQLDNARLFVGKNNPGGSNGGGFQNTTGYTTLDGGFVMMSGGIGAVQAVNAAAIDAGATFGNFGVANNSGATPCVTFGAGSVMMGDFYLAAGQVNPTNLDFQAGSPYSTIFRTEGTFSVVLPDPTSKVNVTYYGGDKTTSNEVPAGASKLWNLTVATTNGAKPGYGIITMNGPLTVNGTLTINANQALYTAANALTINGSAAVINGYLVDDGTARVTLGAATGTTFTGSGFLPSLIVGNGSMNNSVTGYTGVYSQGFGADGIWGGVGANADDFTTADGNISYASGADAGSSLTVGFTGAGPHFGNLTIGAAPLTTTGTETFSLSSNVVMSGNITQGAGVIALGDYMLTHNGATFTMNVDGTSGVTVSSITSTAKGALVFVTNNTALNVTTSGGGSGPAVIAANIMFNSPGNTIKLPAYVVGVTDKLTITGNVTLFDNSAGTLGTTVDVGNGNNLALGGLGVTVSANSAFTATAGGTTGILTLFNAGSNALLTFTIPASASVANLTVSGNVMLAGGVASSTLTVNNFVHTAGLFTFGTANLQINNTFTRNGGTYSGDGWLIYNGLAAGFQHSAIAAADVMTINNFKVNANITLQNTRNLIVVKNLYLNTGSIVNQVGGTGGGYIFCGDANNVPMITVVETKDVTVNALQFNNANADFTFNGLAGTITGTVWPAAMTTLARDVNVNLAGAANILTLGTSRQINRNLMLTQGILQWDSPIVLTLASGVTVTRNVNGSLDKDANADGTTGTLTAANVNLVYTNGVGMSGIEYSDPVKVTNLTVGTPNGSTVTLNSARKVEGVVAINGTTATISTLTINANTEFTMAQTIAAGGKIVINPTFTLTLSGTDASSLWAVTGGGTLIAAGPLTLTGVSNVNVTVAGPLNINANFTGGTITASDNVTIATGVTLGAATNLTFVSAKNATLTVPSTGAKIGTLTINKTNNTNKVVLSGGNLSTTLPGVAPFASVYFVNGIFVTSATNSLNIADPLFQGGQGFDRTGVTGTNISHVVGNVQKTLINGGGGIFGLATSSEPRQEWPVGNYTQYKPVALTFNPQIGGLPTTPNATIQVTYIDGDAQGYEGLPIMDGVAQGVDIGKYPGFYWAISTSPYSIGPSTPFDMELTADGYAYSGDPNELRIIRRHGAPTDIQNKWLLQTYNDVPNPTSYDNSINNGNVTVIVRGANAGLRTGGAIFTYGLKTKIKVTNPIADQTMVQGTPARTFDLSTVFVGNTGTLTFSATSSYADYASVSVSGSTLTLTPLAAGNAQVTVYAQDSYDNDRAAFTFWAHVGLVDVKVNDIPTEFALFQNYPNPFNPTTNIKFDLPKESNVTLKIYNILGEEVATLVNGVMQAGHQEVKFDATRFASGMYIYRIQAGSFVQVKKMLLMK